MLKLIAAGGLAALVLAAAPAFAAAPAQAQTVNDLHDRQLILELMADYGFALDDSDGEAYANLFTPDGVLIAGGGEEFRGHDAIKRMGASTGQRQSGSTPTPPAVGPIHHLFSNVSMKINGDTAAVRAYWVVVNGHTGTAVIQSMGRYDDKLVKRNGRWVYTQRRFINETLQAAAARAAEKN
jgi:uncharacterized protein (TIGR02246 family)